MRSHLMSVVAGALVAILCLAGAGLAVEPDAAGSADYAGIGRFEGAWITYYDAKDFDAFWFASGKVSGPQHGEGQSLEGKVTRIAYRHAAGPSILEVSRNLENRLTDQGYTIVFNCPAADCGGADFGYSGTEVLPVPFMTLDMDNYQYIAAKKAGAPDTYVSILVSENNGEVVYQEIVAEVGQMANRMVDAKQMAKSIADTGKIAIYGILFDTDKADIKPESRPALDQIGQLMSDNADLKILVVGHTDNQGTMDHNLKLSMARAQAIVKELETAYGITADRLTPAGAGFLAPVASNRSEDGARAESPRGAGRALAPRSEKGGRSRPFETSVLLVISSSRGRSCSSRTPCRGSGCHRPWSVP